MLCHAPLTCTFSDAQWPAVSVADTLTLHLISGGCAKHVATASYCDAHGGRYFG